MSMKKRTASTGRRSGHQCLNSSRSRASSTASRTSVSSKPSKPAVSGRGASVKKAASPNTRQQPSWAAGGASTELSGATLRDHLPKTLRTFFCTKASACPAKTIRRGKPLRSVSPADCGGGSSGTSTSRKKFKRGFNTSSTHPSGGGSSGIPCTSAPSTTAPAGIPELLRYIKSVCAAADFAAGSHSPVSASSVHREQGSGSFSGVSAGGNAFVIAVPISGRKKSTAGSPNVASSLSEGKSYGSCGFGGSGGGGGSSGIDSDSIVRSIEQLQTSVLPSTMATTTLGGGATMGGTAFSPAASPTRKGVDADKITTLHCHDDVLPAVSDQHNCSHARQEESAGRGGGEDTQRHNISPLRSPHLSSVATQIYHQQPPPQPTGPRKKYWKVLLLKSTSTFPLLVAAARSEVMVSSPRVAAALLSTLYSILRGVPYGRQRKAVHLCEKLGLVKACGAVLRAYSAASSSGSSSGDGGVARGEAFDLFASQARACEAAALLLVLCASYDAKVSVMIRFSRDLMHMFSAIEGLSTFIEKRFQQGGKASDFDTHSTTGRKERAKLLEEVGRLRSSSVAATSAFLHITLALFSFGKSSGNAQTLGPRCVGVCARAIATVAPFLLQVAPKLLTAIAGATLTQSTSTAFPSNVGATTAIAGGGGSALSPLATPSGERCSSGTRERVSFSSSVTDCPHTTTTSSTVAVPAWLVAWLRHLEQLLFWSAALLQRVCAAVSPMVVRQGCCAEAHHHNALKWLLRLIGTDPTLCSVSPAQSPHVDKSLEQQHHEAHKEEHHGHQLHPSRSPSPPEDASVVVQRLLSRRSEVAQVALLALGEILLGNRHTGFQQLAELGGLKAVVGRVLTLSENDPRQWHAYYLRLCVLYGVSALPSSPDVDAKALDGRISTKLRARLTSFTVEAATNTASGVGAVPFSVAAAAAVVTPTSRDALDDVEDEDDIFSYQKHEGDDDNALEPEESESNRMGSSESMGNESSCHTDDGVPRDDAQSAAMDLLTIDCNPEWYSPELRDGVVEPATALSPTSDIRFPWLFTHVGPLHSVAQGSPLSRNAIAESMETRHHHGGGDHFHRGESPAAAAADALAIGGSVGRGGSSFSSEGLTLLVPPTSEERVSIYKHHIARLTLLEEKHFDSAQDPTLRHSHDVVYERNALFSHSATLNGDDESAEKAVDSSNNRNSGSGTCAGGDNKPAYRGLLFQANFESGNLMRAIRVAEDEYDLILSWDTATNSYVQWFLFSIANFEPGKTYRFNIVNMEKGESTFNEGQRPLMMHVPEGVSALDPHRGKRQFGEWLRVGEGIAYFKNSYERPPRDHVFTKPQGTEAASGNVQGSKRPAGKRPGPGAPRPNGKVAKRRAGGTRQAKKGAAATTSGAALGGGGGGGSAMTAATSAATTTRYFTLTFCVKMPSSEGGRVFLTNCFPFTYTEMRCHLDTLLGVPAKPRQGHSRSGAGVEVMAQSMCDTIGGLPVPLLTATALHRADTGEAYTEEEIRRRPVCLLAARVHPGESNSSWVMQGLLDYLLNPNAPSRHASPRDGAGGGGGTASARENHRPPDSQSQGSASSPLIPLLPPRDLLESFVFKIIPMINPDGVVMGNHRCSLAGFDLNRDYSTPSPELNPTVYAMKQLLRHITRRENRKVILFSDFHGHSRAKNFLLYGCTEETIKVLSRQRRKAKASAAAAAATAPSNALAPEKLLPIFLSLICPTFQLSQSNFAVQKSKCTSARVVMYKELGIRMSFGVEGTMMGGRGTTPYWIPQTSASATSGSPRGAVAVAANGADNEKVVIETHYTQEMFRDFGRAFMRSLYLLLVCERCVVEATEAGLSEEQDLSPLQRRAWAMLAASDCSRLPPKYVPLVNDASLSQQPTRFASPLSISSERFPQASTMAKMYTAGGGGGQNQDGGLSVCTGSVVTISSTNSGQGLAAGNIVLAARTERRAGASSPLRSTPLSDLLSVHEHAGLPLEEKRDVLRCLLRDDQLQFEDGDDDDEGSFAGENSGGDEDDDGDDSASFGSGGGISKGAADNGGARRAANSGPSSDILNMGDDDGGESEGFYLGASLSDLSLSDGEEDDDDEGQGEEEICGSSFYGDDEGANGEDEDDENDDEQNDAYMDVQEISQDVFLL